MAERTMPVVGRYRDLSLLGEGGMGAVYRAYDPSLDRIVAIKLMKDKSPDFMARFEREARALARLSHPRVVAIYDFGKDAEGNPYFVMELLSGRSLDKLLEERGRLTPQEVVRVLRMAAEGLHAAHQQGIVHCDIKPANLVLDDSGELKLTLPKLPDEFYTLMKWADERRRLKVRTNADTPEDAQKAIEMGAEGIGLCRTEHMFFSTQARQLAIQEMIVAETQAARVAALGKLLPYQKEDFVGIFRAMGGRPVTIRLIDPPLHEFVPKTREQADALSRATGIPADRILQRSEQLHEANPMLGHRGCRLCITYPEILDMQVRAIIEAAVEVKKSGGKVEPEIMIPLTIDAKELRILTERTRAVADAILAREKVRIPYLVGTMIETPRAALTAERIAEVAEFFSFGTNDLTQMTMGLSRDDAGRFLPDYVDQSKAAVFAEDPFQSLDQEGVGLLVDHAIRHGRDARARLKIGICGEHGGEARSVKFCHRVGMDYVSCSPYRVPIARLAAAQAVIDEQRSSKSAGSAAARKKAGSSKSSGQSAPRRTAANRKTAAGKRRAGRAR